MKGNIPPIPSPTGSVSSSRNSSQQGSARSSISSQNSAGRGPIRGINIGADLPAAGKKSSHKALLAKFVYNCILLVKLTWNIQIYTFKIVILRYSTYLA